MSWGYWEIAYVDPYNSASYHVHRPGAYWVAGELTPSAYIQDLIADNITATYRGGAHGSYMTNATQMGLLTNGVTNLTINFGAGSNPVSGSITFDQVQLNVLNSTVTASQSQFITTVSGATTSRINGGFFGPGANAVGGNFAAEISGTTYVGVFDALRQ